MSSTDQMADALALHLDVPLDDLKTRSYAHYGLDVVAVGSQEWAVAEDEYDADNAAEEYVKEHLWAFNSSFISSYLDIDSRAIEAIQSTMNEDANGVFEALIESKGSVEDFAQDAVEEDGRGTFLSSYDGEEIELTATDEDGDEYTFYAYRIQ